jgi:uncharacterized glyoxalase superfamily protein PhnB
VTNQLLELYPRALPEVYGYPLDAIDQLLSSPIGTTERQTTMDTLTAAPTITSALACDDPRGLIRWLVDVLEFRVGPVYDDPDGGVAHAQLSWREGNVFVSSRQPTVWGQTGPASICLAADDPAEIDRLYQRARAAGADVVLEIEDADYGSHQFGLRDPEGNVWTVGTYRPPVVTG